MRSWGEDAALLAAAAADTDALARLEDDLERGLGDLPRAGGLDAHAHLGRDRDGHAMDPAALVADLDRWGLAAAVCFPSDEPGEDGQFTAANAAVAAAARRFPGRVIPFCRVDPSRPGAEQAMEVAAADGARGLKLHPVAQRLRPESAGFAAVVRDATRRGWPVTIHAGYGARALAAPIAALLAAVPEARLVLAHAGRGDARALAAALPGWPGVMLDTSLAALTDLVTLPPARLAFGADRPYGEHGTALALVAAARAAAGWGDAEVEGVMGGNLRRWLT